MKNEDEFKFIHTSKCDDLNINRTICITTKDFELHDVVSEFRLFLLGLGYDPESVNKYLDLE